MRDKNRLRYHVWQRLLPPLAVGATGTLFGMVVAVFVAGNQAPVHGLVDPTPYQNFALLVGALAGSLVAVLAFWAYWFIARRSPYRALTQCGFLTGGIAGALIWLLTYSIPVILADRYDMASGNDITVVIDGCISLVAGFIAGAVIGLLLVAFARHGPGR